jgi:hypothetical protein
MRNCLGLIISVSSPLNVIEDRDTGSGDSKQTSANADVQIQLGKAQSPESDRGSCGTISDFGY